MKQTVYVVCRDWGYEGYGEPSGVFTSVDKLLEQYPNAIESTGKIHEGFTYFVLELDTVINPEISSC